MEWEIKEVMSLDIADSRTALLLFSNFCEKKARKNYGETKIKKLRRTIKRSCEDNTKTNKNKDGIYLEWMYYEDYLKKHWF